MVRSETSPPSPKPAGGAGTLATWLARGSVAAVSLFSIAWATLGLARDGYSFVSQPISGLGVGPYAAVMNSAFVLTGLLTAMGAIGTLASIREVGVFARWTCAALLALPGVGSVLCGLFTWEAFAPHMVGSALGLAGPILGFFASAVALGRIPRWRRLGAWLLVSAAVTLILAGLFFATFSVEAVEAGRGVSGLIERVLVVEIQALYAAMAVAATAKGPARKAYEGPASSTSSCVAPHSRTSRIPSAP